MMMMMSMQLVRIMMSWVLLLQYYILIISITGIGIGVAAINVARPNCREQCGNVTIPFPFGIGAECALNSWFQISCNQTTSTPSLTAIGVEVSAILQSGTTGSGNGTNYVRVRSPVISHNCPGRGSGSSVGKVALNLTGSPFALDFRNTFIAAGCRSRAFMSGTSPAIVGCESNCGDRDIMFGRNNISSSSSICNDGTCCRTDIPSRDLQVFNATFESDSGGCKLAFVAEDDWLRSNDTDPTRLSSMEHVPTLLSWGIPDFRSLQLPATSTDEYYCQTLRSINSTLCYCAYGYEGNPYLLNGCQDIDECKHPEWTRRKVCGDATCVNTVGSFQCERRKLWIIILGPSLGFGVLLLLIGGWWLYKYLKKRRETKLKHKFFKQNGGLLLQQQTFSSQGSIETTKIFTSNELNKATDNFSKNRELGQGGQGTVYKGMLVDGRIVAVKKSKGVDSDRVEEFINEVVILSQINHRNVVKLLGCCLETQVPLLVYEFIPNGSLFHYLHDQSNNDEFQLSWEIRMRIAKEIAEALSYLHSSAAIPIYHRDIKSLNILLDANYRAKVSDFGTSRSISIDQTHLTTNVQGTFGYLDPEYFQSSQFTEKSDVYSFGVVLVELLTGEKPISSQRAEEGRSLATHFIVSMEQNQLFDIVDVRVKKEAKHEELVMVAKLAYRCLSLSGRKRPTMKEVAMELERVLSLQKDSNVQDGEDQEEIACVKVDITCPWDAASTSTGSTVHFDTTSSIETEPLMY